MPLSALIRSYRIGHWRFLQWCLDELDRQGADESLSAATNWRMLNMSFGYIDRVTEHVIDVYQLERDHWLLSRTAVRAARVRDILAGKDVDLDWAESALGYRIRQYHLGLVSWLPPLAEAGAGLARLDRTTTVLAEVLGCPGRPLFVPGTRRCPGRGCRSAHATTSPGNRCRTRSRAPTPLCMCAWGTWSPASGIPLHAPSGTAHTGSGDAGKSRHPVHRVLPGGSDRLDVRQCRGHARLGVGVLGPLAVDDENCARLRETVQIFLDTGCSYTATAGAQILHKNTVHYRIRKAEEIMGHPVHERRIDLKSRCSPSSTSA